MKKFSYAIEFDSVVKVTRMDDCDDLSVQFLALVGDPDLKFTFLDSGKAFSEMFTTYRDAINAVSLVQKTLELVDKNLSHGLKLSDLRDEVLASVSKKFDIDGDPDDPDLLNLRPAVERAIKEIFDYYISNGE